MNRRAAKRGFTLLELVFVLVIISATLALAAPSLRGFSRGSKLRDTSEELLAIIRYGRAQAIANGNVYRLNVDINAGRYWLTQQQGEHFSELGTSWGHRFSVPDGCTISLVDEKGSAIESLDFWPSGRTQVSTVRITSGSDVTTIACPSPAEGFRIQTDQTR